MLAHMTCWVLIPFRSGLLWNETAAAPAETFTVLIPFRSGLLWNRRRRQAWQLPGVLIPFRSGLLWNRRIEVQFGDADRLNPL